MTNRAVASVAAQMAARQADDARDGYYSVREGLLDEAAELEELANELEKMADDLKGGE